MQKKSSEPGKGTSVAEIQQISPFGMWLYIDGDKSIEAIFDKSKVYTLHGYTPQHLASSWNKTAALRTLIRLGADVNVATQRACGLHVAGETPLYEAASGGHVDSIRILCDAGAFVNAKNQSGETPLAIAVLRGHTDAVKLLLEYGADPDHTVWRWGITIDAVAISSGNKDCIAILRSWKEQQKLLSKN